MKQKEQGEVRTLCDDCIRSAAPPSLQCVWDYSRAQELPKGADYVVIGADAITGKDRIRITKCPEYLSIYDENNMKLLQEERRKNTKKILKEYTEKYNSCTEMHAKL